MEIPFEFDKWFIDGKGFRRLIIFDVRDKKMIPRVWHQAARSYNVDNKSVVFAYREFLDNVPAVPKPEAADIIGVSERTIERLIADGKLEVILRKGRTWVTTASIQRYLEEKYPSFFFAGKITGKLD